MSKLYFYYGTVCSSKTLNLIAVYNNYSIQNKKAILIKSSLDTRTEKISSRAGVECDPDLIIEKNDSIEEKLFDLLKNSSNQKIDAIIVDEAQFLTKKQVIELRRLAVGKFIHQTENVKNFSIIDKIKDSLFTKKIFVKCPILCYGLRTNSDGELWEASAELMACSDELHEIKTICSYCSHRAVFSAMIKDNDKKDMIDPSWDKYIPVCPKHYEELKSKQENKQTKNS